MNKKRKVVFFILIFTLVLNLFLISSVSAASYSSSSIGYDLRQGAENVIDITVDIFEPFIDVILGGEDYSGLLLFEKFLLFLIFMGIVFLSIDRIGIFDEQPAVKWIIAVVVPILSLRFIDVKWLNTILMQYQVLGIALLGILPFIIYLFFLHNESFNPIVRKIGWIFFIVVYFGLWTTSETDNYAQVYFWTMLVAFIFLFLDGSIHKYFEKMQWEEAGADAKYQEIAKIDKAIREIEASSIPEKKKIKLIKKKTKRKEDLYKNL